PGLQTRLKPAVSKVELTESVWGEEIRIGSDQFLILNSHPRGRQTAISGRMIEKLVLSDQLEERLIEFAARIIGFAGALAKTFQGQHIARQILRSGTDGAANYAEARGAESCADFIHKMRLVQKELNETAVWLRVILKSSLVSSDLIVT